MDIADAVMVHVVKDDTPPKITPATLKDCYMIFRSYVPPTGSPQDCVLPHAPKRKYASATVVGNLPVVTGQSSQTSNGAVTAPTALQNIAFTGVLPAGEYTVSVQAYFSGTVTAADQNNMEIAAGSFLSGIEIPALINTPVSETAQVSFTVPTFVSVVAKGAGSVAAVYNVAIEVTPIVLANSNIILGNSLSDLENFSLTLGGNALVLAPGMTVPLLGTTEVWCAALATPNTTAPLVAFESVYER